MQKAETAALDKRPKSSSRHEARFEQMHRQPLNAASQSDLGGQDVDDDFEGGRGSDGISNQTQLQAFDERNSPFRLDAHVESDDIAEEFRVAEAEFRLHLSVAKAETEATQAAAASAASEAAAEASSLRASEVELKKQVGTRIPVHMQEISARRTTLDARCTNE